MWHFSVWLYSHEILQAGRQVGKQGGRQGGREGRGAGREGEEREGGRKEEKEKNRTLDFSGFCLNQGQHWFSLVLYLRTMY